MTNTPHISPTPIYSGHSGCPECGLFKPPHGVPYAYAGPMCQCHWRNPTNIGTAIAGEMVHLSKYEYDRLLGIERLYKQNQTTINHKIESLIEHIRSWQSLV